MCKYVDEAREHHPEIIQTPDHIIQLCYPISLCQLTPKVARNFHCEGQIHLILLAVKVMAGSAR